MKERPLIPAEQQVAHLAERGVRFDIMSPKDAVAFLRDKNFFFKVKAFAKCFPVIHDFTALVLCFDRIVSDTDARSEKAAGLRTLRERFLEHADYFEKQIELDRGIRMLGEVMRSGADVISSSSL